MKWQIDGDHVMIMSDNFVDLQESPAVFIPANSYVGKLVISGGVTNMPLRELTQCRQMLAGDGGVLSGDY